jgi:hypothetical protein
MDEIISYKMCAVKVRNAKLRNYLKYSIYIIIAQVAFFKLVVWLSDGHFVAQLENTTEGCNYARSLEGTTNLQCTV